MRVLSAVVAAGVALAVPMGVSADVVSPDTHVQVAPSAIGTHTDVLLRFRQPVTTGENGDERSFETLVFGGPSRPRCIGARRVVLAAAHAGTTVRHLLRPGFLGGSWCTGTYEGRLTLQVQPDCTGTGPVTAQAVACPMFIMAPRTLATFHFRVTAS